MGGSSCTELHYPVASHGFRVVQLVVMVFVVLGVISFRSCRMPRTCL